MFPNQKKHLYHIEFSFLADPPAVQTSPRENGEVSFRTIEMPWQEDKMAFTVPVVVRFVCNYLIFRAQGGPIFMDPCLTCV